MRLLGMLLMITGWSYGQGYFQQEVNYTIKVSLDDQANVLHAHESFEYINNSPDELNFIYIHLWPNAYKDNSSAMSLQQFRNGNKIMENNSERDKGYIDSLDFKVNGESATFLYNLNHNDIGKLLLKTPLKPGEKITVSTPFRVKIPNGNISRLGHVGESFQVTQWYPKPAVYDKEGWHHMPYLTQGEFYSEFGSFDVSITLPENYVVGATGDLQTKSEIEFLNKKVKETQKKIEENKFDSKAYKRSFPESSSKMKTIRYTQSRVHDFAWFADKRYEVLKGEVKLPHSKRKVTTWAMFTPQNGSLWQDAIEYINDGTYWYSKWNGDYPYNQVTAVDGTISAGGGMEYPNVTVIGSSGSATQLELVIVHEVGHNWFYGILGSNERVHPWMDEGMNTANEIRYFKNKYPDNTEFSENFGGIADALHLGGISHHCGNDMTYQFSSNNGKDQPIELHSNEYTPLNYGAIVYAKTGLVFTYLRDYLGDELYDACMSDYYEKWKFKHPQPADMKAVFESKTGKDLTWFFDDIINTTNQLDFKIKSVRKDKVSGSYTVSVANVGDVRAPVKVFAYKNEVKVDSVWLETNENFSIDKGVFKAQEIDKVVIDGDKNMPETNRMNNSWEKSRLLNRVEPINFEFLAGDNEPDKNTIWWTPVFGANAYDKFMLGALFHNVSIPKNRLEFYVAPMYSFGNNRLTGLGDVHLNITPARNIKKIEIGVKGQTFGEEYYNEFFGNTNYYANSNANPYYWVIKPYVFAELGKFPERQNFSQTLEVQLMKSEGMDKEGNGYHGDKGGFLEYNFNLKRRNYRLDASYRIDYLQDEKGLRKNANSFFNFVNTFTYKVKKEKDIELRVFMGHNLLSEVVGTPPYSNTGFALGGQNGTQDYFYEQLMFGRNELQGVFGQQRIENHGAFKTVSDFGFSNKFMASANLYAELPWGPIGVFADYGVFDNGNKLITAADAGLGLRLLNGDLAVYFPLLQTDNLSNSLSGLDYLNTVRFTINLSNYSYRKLLNRL